eukprot:TRINITY_DN7413_c0_g1_i1.p1 TRINITY_DN7413_c0_g1~~TRINITY_DN7413_c0_g1_i1.p1  ORF type:complete len:287 (+),score=78.39 TRINITY_DN7413_c0_g1_i1:314-1174(+)
MFEQVLETVPPASAKMIYIMYADLEERYGLARKAMNIYERATKHVLTEERAGMYLIYIAKATEFFGISKTREVFEQAIGTLPDKDVKDLCVRYAKMETTLGEIDRARAIYTHASQYSDPRVDTAFWKGWSNFELKHGSKDTFADMLRVKRSVQQKYNTQVNFMSAEMLAASKKADTDERGIKRREDDYMAMLEREARAIAQPIIEEINKAREAKRESAAENNGETLAKMGENPEEIDLKEEGEEEEDVEEVEGSNLVCQRECLVIWVRKVLRRERQRVQISELLKG